MTVSSFEDDTVASKGGQGGASFSAITAITSNYFGMASPSLLVTQSTPVTVAPVTKQVEVFFENLGIRPSKD